MNSTKLTGAMAALVAFRQPKGGAATVEDIPALVTELCHLMDLVGDYEHERGCETANQVRRAVEEALWDYVRERNEELDAEELP